MTIRSPFLASLSSADRSALERRLLTRQSGQCFICEQSIDLTLHAGHLDLDHIVPLAEQGPDDENNLALVHQSCNRSKGASDLRVARRMAAFDRLQDDAKSAGARGAHLGHLLQAYGGSKEPLRVIREGSAVRFSLPAAGSTAIQSAPLYRDELSGMAYFFAVLPLEYLHHDDRINPRGIGSNIRGLIEEFMKKRPQLHIALAWMAAEDGDSGRVKVFDGQHKAAAQILLGVRSLPVRVFLEPDLNVLLQANTNAGSKLRQVQFDASVMRYLGSTLYAERVREYQRVKCLREDDLSFSEKDLVSFFKGEHRELVRYVVDAVRASVMQSKENRLLEFVEWSGKGSDRPLSYAAVEGTFFKEFLYKKPLGSPIGEGFDTGDSPRSLEQEQLIRLMSTFADIFFANSWDPDVAGNKLENRLQKGEPIPEYHLRAWRIAREEILANVLLYVRLVIENYYAYSGAWLDKERPMQTRFPEPLWQRIELFLRRLSELPCWVDKPLSHTVFGSKQNLDFWKTVFSTGRAPTGVEVLAKPLDVARMLQ